MGATLVKQSPKRQSNRYIVRDQKGSAYGPMPAESGKSQAAWKKQTTPIIDMAKGGKEMAR